MSEPFSMADLILPLSVYVSGMGYVFARAIIAELREQEPSAARRDP